MKTATELAAEAAAATTAAAAVEAEKTKATETGTKPVVELAAPAEGEKKPVEAKPHDRFITAFGAQGAQWFLEGKTFEAAAVEFAALEKTKHETELAALKSENTELKTKLSSAAKQLGNDPVGFQSAEKPAKPAGGNDPKELSAKIGDNLAKVAAATRMPGSKAPPAEE